MKLILCILTFMTLCNLQARAEFKYLVEMSENLKEAGRPFAASFYLKEYLKTNKEKKFHKNYEHLLNLIDLVGYGVFDELSLFDSKSYPFAAMYYHNLKSLIFKKKFKVAFSAYSKFPRKYKANPVFIQLYGFSAYMIGKNVEAESAFKLCLKNSANKEKPHFMSRRNYQLVLEQCQLYLARVHYRNESFLNSIRSYSKIKEESQYYPLVFIERAWSNYQLKMYDEVLGLNLAFQSSWMSPFYDGEIDLLGALSLIRLCRWDDVFYFLSQMHKRGNRMIANVNHVEFFLKNYLEQYLQGNKKIKKKLNNEQRKILVRFQLSSYWDRIHAQYINLALEAKEAKPMLVDRIDGARLKPFLDKQLLEITHKIKKHLLGELSRYRVQLYLMKEKADGLELEILARYRNTIYKSENGLDSLTGDKKVDELKDKKIELQRWAYKNEYWRDEVGKYKLKVPSMCSGDKKELQL